MRQILPLLALAALLGGCGDEREPAEAAGAPAAITPSGAEAGAPPDAAARGPDEAARKAAAQIRAADLLQHIRALASDEFQGRLPGTIGEEKTVDYLREQFTALGLQPGNPDGSYVQKVRLAGIDSSPALQVTAGGRPLPLDYRRDYVAATRRFVPEVTVSDSPLVFVGYGVQAPEYDWDDYKGQDLRGKTLLMLVNDPAVPDPDDPGALDERLFRGKAMTYYGRWTYKYEIAGKLGADAAIIIHETGPAGYPWAVVESSWTGEQFTLASADGNRAAVPVQAWISLDKARTLLEASGQSFEALKQAALQRDFEPVPLDARVSFTIRNKTREVDSHNVVARIEGADAERADEYVIYTAHWDHLGVDPSLAGDPIYNGALDNATGVAALLEIGQAYRALPAPPARSILLLAVTAEEQGLLGSEFYATNPLYPLDNTLAVINMDAMNPWGPTRDVQVIGAGQNTLEDTLAAYAAALGREVIPDAEPEKGFYYRSDQFNFAKLGVPALYADGGSEIIGKPGLGQTQRANYTANHYHKPTDEVKADWDLTGAAQDAQLLFYVGLDVAEGDRWPEWKQGSEFKAVRQADLAPAAGVTSRQLDQ